MGNIKIEKFNYKRLFSNLSLEIKENSFTAILGNNNSGKTTLAKILAGIIIRQETVLLGSKYIDYQNTKKLSETISYVIEGLDIPFIKETVQEQLLYAIEPLNLSKNLNAGRLRKIYSDFKLSDYKKTNPNMLDKYTKIKLSLAEALITKPKVLIVDNILRMLSQKEKVEIIKILKKYQEDEKITIIYLTSLPEETMTLDYIHILSNGKIVIEGKPLDILSQEKLMASLNYKVPFMIDLSVKLKFYDLLKDIEIDMERMIETLWKSE